jgi:hypothetical protein
MTFSATQDFKMPDYTWEWCLTTDWTLVVKVVTPPCAFYRWTQQIVFGIQWRKIK